MKQNKTGFPVLDDFVSEGGFKRGEVVSFIGVKGVGKGHFQQMIGRQHRVPLIQTGLQSLDYECKLGGHLIVLIGEAGAGKTAIINTIKDTARKNQKRCCSLNSFESDHTKQLTTLINAPSEVKLIEYMGPTFNGTPWIHDLRRQLIEHNQWAVITVQANRASKMDTIMRAPQDLVRSADYVFGISKRTEAGVSNVVNVKNRYRGEARRTASFPIQFKPKSKNPVVVFAEEINTPIPK